MTSPRPLLNLSAFAALTLIAIAPLYSAYQDLGFWIAAVGGTGAGTLLAYLGARRRWGVLLVTLITAATYFVLGGALAVRQEAILGFLPGPAALAALARGAVQVWKQTLTLQAPFIGWDQLYVAPYLATLMASVLGASLALRLRRYAWALLVPGALLIFAVLFSTYEGFIPSVIGAAAAAVALLWVALRRQTSYGVEVHETESSASVGARRMTTATAVLLVGAMAVAGAATTAWASGQDREVLRDHVIPPLELHDFASPLSSFRKLVKDGEESTLFTVSGLPDGARIRLASLDSYDGVVYRVSGSGGEGSGVFTRVGREIPTSVTGDQVSAQITVADLSGVWVPTVGYLTSIGFETTESGQLDAALHYNTSTGTAMTTLGIQSGETYEFEAVVPSQPSEEDLEDAEIAAVATPTPAVVPAEVSGLLEQILGEASTPWAQIQAIQDYLQSEGYFSHGLEGEVTSASGHSAARISDLLGESQMVGDDEQYAVAMALLISQLGYPVRVVMGFVPEGTGSEVAVTGADAHVWVEVPFEGFGWVALDATPSEDRVPLEQAPQPQQQPRVQVAQPPQDPEEPAELPPTAPVEDTTADDKDQDDDTRQLWPIYTAVGGGILLLVFGPPLVFALIRAHRSSKRKRSGTTADRIDAAWEEILDSALDVGVPAQSGATRREQAMALHVAAPQAALPALAQAADTAVFGPGDPDQAVVSSYWNQTTTAQRSLRKSANLRRRIRARMYPPSVLHRRSKAKGRR